MKLVAKTFHGLEPVLASELESLGAKNINLLKRAVSFDANKELLYKCNLHLRTALRVLQPLTTFTATSADELYNKVKTYNWAPYLKPNQTFALDAVIYSRFFKHSGFVALKVKDAICDQFRETTGSRPSIDTKRPTLLINVHGAEEKFTISIDSSGEPLNRRGYRTRWHPAPINEALAAGMIMISGWDGKTSFLDPMCGSGTIVMEAAMIAAGIAPGINRDDFGFFRWNNFDASLWEKLVADARQKQTRPLINISGSDISIDAIDAARQCALDAGLKQYINFAVKPFSEVSSRERSGVMIINPPYDERMKSGDIVSLYSGIGSQLKHKFPGWNCWVISSNPDALKAIGLKPSERHALFNGALECRFVKFAMHEGSLKPSRREKSELGNASDNLNN